VENKLYLKKKLFRFDYKKGISMAEHLDDFNKIITDLLNLDVKIDDEDKALDDFNKIITDFLNLDVKIDDEDKVLLLLNSLPESYEFLITTLTHSPYVRVWAHQLVRTPLGHFPYLVGILWEPLRSEPVRTSNRHDSAMQSITIVVLPLDVRVRTLVMG